MGYKSVERRGNKPKPKDTINDKLERESFKKTVYLS